MSYVRHRFQTRRSHIYYYVNLHIFSRTTKYSLQDKYKQLAQTRNSNLTQKKAANRNPPFKMTHKKVLVVLPSCGLLGSTGKKTGWYLVRTSFLLLSLDQAILMNHSQNLLIHTTSSHHMSNSPSLPRKAAPRR
jgi:hypothetical protein